MSFLVVPCDDHFAANSFDEVLFCRRREIGLLEAFLKLVKISPLDSDGCYIIRSFPYDCEEVILAAGNLRAEISHQGIRVPKLHIQFCLGPRRRCLVGARFVEAVRQIVALSKTHLLGERDV